MSALQLFSAPGSVFHGLPDDVIDAVLATAQRRAYAAGETLIAEGDHPPRMALVLEGHADVLIAAPNGQQQQQINRVGPGSTLGEMSLLTDEPASATVRAASQLQVLLLTRAQVHKLAASYPRVYQNIGANLALRITRADRRSVGRGAGTLTRLDSRDAPPQLAEALAASIAWHTRRPTLLLRVSAGVARLERLSGPGAHLLVVPPSGRFAPERLTQTLDDLRRRYEHVLVEASTPIRAPRVLLLGPDTVWRACAANAPLAVLRGFSVSAPGARIGPDAHGIVEVPSLRATDDEALANGALPATTPSGARIGWVARHIAHLKVGLALGGGGLKGYAHLGVLRALERGGIHVDYLAGTSIGGVVASLYALNHTPDTIADVLDAAAATLIRPVLSTRSLLSSDRLRHFLRTQGDCVSFENLHTPLALVASDIYSGREVVFRGGLVWPAVLATVAVPGLFPAQPIGPYWLVDGGVLNPVPADVARDMGADVVVAVRLRDERPLGQAEACASVPVGPSPSMLEVLTRSVDLLQGRLSPRAEAAVDVLIEPRCDGAPSLGLRSFNRGRRYIKAGEAAVTTALPTLTRALPWLAR